jgi:hypothetical protein
MRKLSSRLKRGREGDSRSGGDFKRFIERYGRDAVSESRSHSFLITQTLTLGKERREGEGDLETVAQGVTLKGSLRVMDEKQYRKATVISFR